MALTHVGGFTATLRQDDGKVEVLIHVGGLVSMGTLSHARRLAAIMKYFRRCRVPTIVNNQAVLMSRTKAIHPMNP